ncbi:MAG: hypothetical protein JXQ80_03535 [Bacteroidales bacterium]|nr:hypothetical protein [Bacteroidales bacterium]
MIRYLNHTEIDPIRWDHCIGNSNNRLIYAFTWWLDIVSPGWDALVNDDYTVVMPLTCRKKAGIYYLAQPLFTQQLGVFSTGHLTPAVVSAFLNAIPAKFRYTDIQLNYLNRPRHDGSEVQYRNNYTLDLSRSYAGIAAGFHRNCRRNIQKASAAGFHVDNITNLPDFIAFVGDNLEKKVHNLTHGMLPLMRVIVGASIEKGMGELKGVYNTSGELMAAGWFVNDSNRCLFIVCASNTTGKQNQAMHLLIDSVIRAKAGKPVMLDFTGSNMPGVAYFNAGFGAVNGTYPSIRRNALPWPLKLLKR